MDMVLVSAIHFQAISEIHDQFIGPARKPMAGSSTNQDLRTQSNMKVHLRARASASWPGHDACPASSVTVARVRCKRLLSFRLTHVAFYSWGPSGSQLIRTVGCRNFRSFTVPTKSELRLFMNSWTSAFFSLGSENQVPLFSEPVFDRLNENRPCSPTSKLKL